jgi:hypothetical protein
VHEMIGNWINYILQETGKRLSKFWKVPEWSWFRQGLDDDIRSLDPTFPSEGALISPLDAWGACAISLAKRPAPPSSQWFSSNHEKTKIFFFRVLPPLRTGTCNHAKVPLNCIGRCSEDVWTRQMTCQECMRFRREFLCYDGFARVSGESGWRQERLI